ncbi:MAG: phenylalanine 4-monooxygenase [Armatimonadetes bacterium]|nr:phenylalanine 4-monooxygenase [Armatimonadota bacterium]
MGDLTSERSRFIAEAQRQGLHYIHQPYELYSEANHDAWRCLYRGMEDRWQRHANRHFLQGIDRLRLNPNRVPRLEDVNKFLYPLTRFRAVAVSGYLPAFLFFNSLRQRQFPTTITIRDGGDAFAEWPDIFHDITGHVPMHTDPAFAEALVRFGDCAHTAVEMVADIRDEEEQVRRLTSIIRAMARFFWFTVETGLMREGKGLKVYGSALLSSRGEIDHALCSDDVQKHPVQLEWIINQGFLPNHYQPLLFITESFTHLYELVDELERWMRAGRLNNVAPGEPAITEADLKSFLRPVH